MNVIALLPVKAHSQRVPGKNFRMLGEKPLYRWILDTLLACPEISRVVVDTDAPALMDALADCAGVRVLPRPQMLRGDGVSMNDIIAYDLTQCPADAVFLQTHATNPFLSAQTIGAALARFAALTPDYDSLFSVNRIQARTYWPDGSPINHTLGVLAQTQDLTPVLQENSNLFIFTQASFAAAGSRVGARPYLYETPAMESLDIDQEEDFRLAELLLRGLERGEEHG